MRETLYEVVAGTNWESLSNQKSELSYVLAVHGCDAYPRLIDLFDWISDIQDAVVTSGIATAKEVYREDVK